MITVSKVNLKTFHATIFLYPISIEQYFLQANESVHTDDKEALDHKLGVVGSEHGEVVLVQLGSNQILKRYLFISIKY